MNVDVHDGLATGLTNIYSHVETIWMQIVDQFCFRLPEQVKRGYALVLAQLEEVSDVAERNNQEVPFADWIAVKAGIAELILQDDIGRSQGAKGTSHFHKTSIISDAS